jgi:hypothetical protein
VSCHGWQQLELFSQIALAEVVCEGLFDASDKCCGHADAAAVLQATVDSCYCMSSNRGLMLLHEPCASWNR